MSLPHQSLRLLPRRPSPGAGWVPLHPTHYERLGLTEDTAPGHIAAMLAPGPQSGAELRLAHAVLCDPLRRTVYDNWLARERAAAAGQARRARVSRLARRALIGGVLAIMGVLALGWALGLAPDCWAPAMGCHQAVEPVKVPAPPAG